MLLNAQEAFCFPLVAATRSSNNEIGFKCSLAANAIRVRPGADCSSASIASNRSQPTAPSPAHLCQSYLVNTYTYPMSPPRQI